MNGIRMPPLATGGLVLCHGRSSSLTLANVHLDGCRLIVVDGAEAKLEDVTVHYLGNSPAVVVSGRDTTLRAKNVMIAADYGNLVEEGAMFIGEHVRMEGARVVGVCARDESTFLSLSDSHIICTATHTQARTAVIAAGGVAAVMYKCTLTDFSEGVSIASKAEVTLTECILDMAGTSSGIDRAAVSVHGGRVVWVRTAVLNATGSWIWLAGLPSPVQARLTSRVTQASEVHAATTTATDAVVCTVDGENIVYW